MREIKFRVFYPWAKEQELEEMQYFDLNNRPYGMTDSPNIVMQFTGLYDKQGKEIYEGDVVKITERENIGTFNVPDDIIANGGYTGREDVYRGEVKYQGCSFGVDDKDNGFIYLEWDKDCGEAEIIGNIYENGNLLNENKIQE